jgi:hypothetical protein
VGGPGGVGGGAGARGMVVREWRGVLWCREKNNGAGDSMHVMGGQGECRGVEDGGSEIEKLAALFLGTAPLFACVHSPAHIIQRERAPWPHLILAHTWTPSGP